MVTINVKLYHKEYNRLKAIGLSDDIIRSEMQRLRQESKVLLLHYYKNK